MWGGGGKSLKDLLVRAKTLVGKEDGKFLEINNYCSWHKKLFRGQSVIQLSFHAPFMLDEHCGIDDWEIILTDKWQNK